MKVRSVFAGAVALVVLALIGGVLAFGRGTPSPSVRLAAGSAWFPTRSQGSVALLDGSTGSRVTRLEHAAPPGAPVVVEQAGSSALVVDPDAGTVTKIDGATWQASAPLHAADGRDEQLAVRATSDTAWVVSQDRTVVRQLDLRTMAFTGGPQALPPSVTDVAIAPDGTLWVVAGSGDVRSFRDGQPVTQGTLGDGGRFALAMVGSRPVAVDVGSGAATVIDPNRGGPAGSACMDLPTAVAPAIGGAGGDAPWLLGVSPAAGTLIVSDLDADRCQPVVLGPTSATPRYGSPVELKRLVFVPDEEAGQVIVVDPAAAPDRLVKARIDLGFRQTPVSLLVHDDHVWFNEVDGDRAGVITDDLTALVSSKADAGSAAGERPKAPAGDAAAGGAGAPSAAPGGATSSAGTGAATPSANPRASSTSAGGSNLPAPAAGDPGAADLPAPSADGGGGGGDGSGSGPDGGGGDAAGNAVDFSSTPTTPTVGQTVTFTDTSTGDHTVTGWSAPDGLPSSSTNGSTTFDTVFKRAGTFDVVLTVSSGGAAKSVTHAVTVAAQLVVPDLHGMTQDQARATLRTLGHDLTLAMLPTAQVDSALATGSVVDTDPASGSPVEPGTVVNFRAANALPYQEFQIPGYEGGGNFQDMIVGPDGNLWATEDNDNQLIRITPEGKVKKFNVDPSRPRAPHALVIGPDKHLWLTYRFGPELVRVTVNADDTLSFELHHIATQVAVPTDVIVGPDGNFWVAELDNNTIGIYSPTGAPIRDLTISGGNIELASLVKGTDGLVYAGEASGRKIVGFNASGPVVFHATVNDVGGLQVLPNGSLVFAMPDGLYLLNDPSSPASTPIRFRRGDNLGSPYVTSHGDIWFFDPATSAITQTDTLGNTVRTVPQNLSGKNPIHLIDGPEGMLWFLESKVGRVARVTF